MEANFLTRHPSLKDGLNFFIFVVLVLVGTLFINTFVFRTFNVVGPSMEPTMSTGDRLIVNRVPVTFSQLQNDPYLPDRNQVIVFRNPQFVEGGQDEFIVKRVIAFAGERVQVKNGQMTVYNQANPDGFDPNDSVTDGQPASPISGDVNTVVAEGTIFVVGDNRRGDYSFDSRSGLGNVPLYDVIGPVAVRIWPLTSIDTF